MPSTPTICSPISMGDIASVFSRTATRINSIEVEDCAVASLQMQSGRWPRSASRSARPRRSAGCGCASSMSPSKARLHPTPQVTIPGRSSRPRPRLKCVSPPRSPAGPDVPSRFEGLMAAYHQALRIRRSVARHHCRRAAFAGTDHPRFIMPRKPVSRCNFRSRRRIRNIQAGGHTSTPDHFGIDRAMTGSCSASGCMLGLFTVTFRIALKAE